MTAQQRPGPAWWWDHKPLPGTTALLSQPDETHLVEARLEDAAFLIARGCTAAQVCARTGIGPAALDKAVDRGLLPRPAALLSVVDQRAVGLERAAAQRAKRAHARQNT